MKQRILALLLAAGLCLGLITAAPALAFSDVSGEGHCLRVLRRELPPGRRADPRPVL